MSTALPVVYDRRRAAAYDQESATGLPPGALAPADAVHDPTRTPVVLVHGTSGRAARDWFTLAPLLTNLGLPVFCFSWELAAPDGRPATSVDTDALGELLDEVATRTGSPLVDLVGHSWGATLARAVVRRPLSQHWRARTLVGLAPTYAGTTLHGLSRWADSERGKGARSWLDANLPAWREQMAGSDVLTAIADPALDTYDAEVAYTTIVTRFDQVVTPFRAAFEAEPRAEQVVVQDTCLTDLTDHVAITHDAIALWHVVRALAPGREGPQPHGFVVPLVGGPASCSTAGA